MDSEADLSKIVLLVQIVVMEGGRILQQGSYADLLSASGGAFSRLIAEFGSAANHAAAEPGGEAGEETIEDVVAGSKANKEVEELEKEEEKVKGAGTKYSEKGAAGAKLMQAEGRETGGVSWAVYTVRPTLFGNLLVQAKADDGFPSYSLQHYFQSMGSILWAPTLLAIYGMAQIATVGNTVFLGFWSEQSISSFHSEGPYMAM